MIVLMTALVLIGTLLVSCNQNVGEDKLGSVTISQDMARTLSSTAESTLPSSDGITWYYKAVKNDDGFFVTGQTDWTDLAGALAGQNLGNFSYGSWLFSFEGRNGNDVIYSCYDLPASISTPQTNLTVPLTLGSGANAPIVEFRGLSFKLAEGSGSAGTTATGLFKLVVSEGTEEIFTVTTGSTTYLSSGVSFDLSSVTGAVLDNTNSVYYVQKTYGSAVSHTYGFKVYFQKDGSSSWQTVADRTYSVLIPFGAKITISGSVDSIETTGQMIIDGTQTHSYALLSDGSWQCQTCSANSGNHLENNILAGTGHAYITVVENGQPTDIIPLTDARAVGSTGSITVSGSNVTYTNNGTGAVAQEVVIRTEGGTLTINAPSDTVNHYGDATVVNVQEIAGSSYHENGVVDLIKVKKGHIELESNAEVLGVYVYNDSTDTVKATSFEEIKITVKAGAEVPQLSRSAVEIDPTNGTKVCTVVTEESKDIYLFQQGVYQQIKTVNAGENIASHASASWADNNLKNNEKTQTAAHQLANELNTSFTVGETTYSVTVDTGSANRELVVTNTSTSAVVTDATIVAKAVDQSAYDGDEAVADLPLRGDGLSWDTAFEVYDYATMQKINYYAGQDRYFKVVIEKTDNGHIDLDNWSYIYMDGHFDGSGVIFDNLDQTLFYGPYKSQQFDARNFTISKSASISGWGTGAAVLYVGAPVNHLSNITVHGYIQGADRAAAFVGWGKYSFGTQEWYFDNCYSDATLVGACAGGFIAHPYNYSEGVYCHAYAYFNDSLFEGVMQTSGSSKPNYINGNHSGAASGSAVYMNFTDASLLSRFNAVCETVLGVNTNENGYAYVYGQNNPSTPFNSMCDYLKRSTIETIGHTLEGMSLGDTFSASKNDNAEKAIITFNVGPNGVSESGNYVGTYLKDEFTSFEGETITSSVVRYYTIAVNPGDVDATGVYDTRLCIVGEQYGKTYGSASVTISQYDSNGYLIQLDVWALPVE